MVFLKCLNTIVATAWFKAAARGEKGGYGNLIQPDYPQKQQIGQAK